MKKTYLFTHLILITTLFCTTWVVAQTSIKKKSPTAQSTKKPLFPPLPTSIKRTPTTPPSKKPTPNTGVPKGTAIVSRRDASKTIVPLQSSTPHTLAKSEVTINWENVTLKDCIEILSRDLGMEFIISPSVNVTQEISIRAGDITNWDRKHKLELFDAILDTAGIQRTLRGRIWIFSPANVRPIVEAFQPDQPGDGKPIIGVIKLKNIDALHAQQFTSVVSGKSPQRTFGIRGSQILIVVGTRAYLKQMEDLVKLIDFPPSVLSHYILKEADAESVAQELNTIFSNRTGGDGSKIRFMAVPRLNTVIAQNLTKNLIPEISRWIKLLDHSDMLNERVTKVYRMQVVEADKIGKTLSSLYSNLYRQTQERDRKLGKKAPARVSTPKKTPSKKPTSSKKSASNTSSSVPINEEVIILSDKDTNTLIINAPASMHKEIARTIHELDKPRRQVLIETTIVEVTLDENTDLGLEWAVQGGGSPANAGSLMTGLQLGEIIDGTVPLTKTAEGLTYLITSNNKKMALIHAAQKNNRLQVLSSPSVLTRDGMKAEVSFGKEVPIRQSTLSSGGNENFSYDYRNAKISLTVTPHIDDNDMVTLNIEQVIRRVEDVETTSKIDAPTFRTREIRSNLRVASGQTIILGGLIERADMKVKIGIPYLMKIPYVGWFFGRNVTRKLGTEILMILTPHVVDTRNETDILTRNFRHKILGSMSEKDIRDLYDLEDGPYEPKKTIIKEEPSKPVESE